jgi:hypothetical protein
MDGPSHRKTAKFEDPQGGFATDDPGEVAREYQVLGISKKGAKTVAKMMVSMRDYAKELGASKPPWFKLEWQGGGGNRTLLVAVAFRVQQPTYWYAHSKRTAEDREAEMTAGMTKQLSPYKSIIKQIWSREYNKSDEITVRLRGDKLGKS